MVFHEVMFRSAAAVSFRSAAAVSQIQWRQWWSRERLIYLLQLLVHVFKFDFDNIEFGCQDVSIVLGELRL